MQHGRVGVAQPAFDFGLQLMRLGALGGEAQGRVESGVRVLP